MNPERVLILLLVGFLYITLLNYVLTKTKREKLNLSTYLSKLTILALFTSAALIMGMSLANWFSSILTGVLVFISISFIYNNILLPLAFPHNSKTNSKKVSMIYQVYVSLSFFPLYGLFYVKLQN